MKTATCISMLRGVNVSGRNAVRMQELKLCYESMGFTGVRTYLQSGNVVFDCPVEDASSLAARIETGIERTFGFSVAVFLRRSSDFRKLLDQNPFTHGRNEDPAKLHVTFLCEAPSPSASSVSKPPPAGEDEFVIRGREVFLFCPHGYGKTKLSNGFFEKALNVPATTRNWKTVNALYAMAGGRRARPGN